MNRARNLILGLVLALVVTRIPQGLHARSKGAGNVGSKPPQLTDDGSKLFSGSCSVCHGIDGRGSARGPDLTQGLMVTRGSDDEVAQVIRKGVPGSSMAGYDLADPQIKPLVAFIRSLSMKAAQLKVPGNPELGKQAFAGKGGCSNCHMIRGQGGLLGPDLSNLGGERTLSEIRESILNPKSSTRRSYKPVRVVTLSGEKVSGTVRNRDNFSLQMVDPQGRLRFFLTQELREIVLEEKSLMPDNYGPLLTPEELQDLLAYLSRQTVSSSEGK